MRIWQSWRIAFGVTLFAVAVALGLSAALFVKNAHERNDRLGQTCTIFEQNQKDDVQALKQTYKFLAIQTPKELQQPINQFIIANLPITEQNAQTDDAPDYCDEEGFGLPEPDPVLPKHRDFTKYLSPDFKKKIADALNPGRAANDEAKRVQDDQQSIHPSAPTPNPQNGSGGTRGSLGGSGGVGHHDPQSAQGDSGGGSTVSGGGTVAGTSQLQGFLSDICDNAAGMGLDLNEATDNVAC